MYNPLYSQELQDEKTAFDEANKDSKPNIQVMRDLLAESEARSSSATYSPPRDVIDLILRSHPNLTREQAEQYSKDFGF
ncbi:hypothetical protein XMG59_001160 [Marinobacterium sp. xm-g-59]|uniref:hypothetical protein n=1 Tax=Marinobacterium sp. xm-g-59 TaxID=2497748 RepID=UPI00156A0B56|nr:hypothetical protein [Marinobacterium sp. xm-g-59]NRP95064.1 hypothetical protein [Marinobacterium sp. xm-g-59]